MQLHTLVDPIYRPEADQQSVLRLGLQSLPISEWILVDEDFSLFHQHKVQQGEKRKQKVYAEIHSSTAAQREFQQVLKKHLLSHLSAQYAADGAKLIHLPSQLSWTSNTDSLWDCSLWIQDDICLLEKLNGEHVMTAASLCSPSNWKLEEKIGRNIDWIHETVPGYQTELAVRVGKLLDGLKPMNPVLRYNWSTQTGNELCWRDDVVDAASEDYFWRVERQTLLRLPETGAIVFAIRLFLHSFDTMSKLDNFNEVLLALAGRQTEEMRNYKGLDEALLKRLQRED